MPGDVSIDARHRVAIRAGAALEQVFGSRLHTQGLRIEVDLEIGPGLGNLTRYLAAVAKNVIGEIYSRFEKAGLKIIAAKMLHLSKEQAEGFYAVHKDRPFFKDLVEFMTSGPVLVQVLEGENAILQNRAVMGATNPGEAEPGTIRADLAETIDENAVHGSDGPDTAKVEIDYFFSADEICPRTR